MNTNWSAADIQRQDGKTAVVTGGSNGIGFHTALELARAGAHVIIGSRDMHRGHEAKKAMVRAVPEAQITVMPLDLADLDSVHEFARGVMAENDGVDLLINNAGVMAVPTRQLTRQGFEMHFGTNHLGHFALTGLLLPHLLKSRGRVVTVSAKSSHSGRLDFSDLASERTYSPMSGYNRSKLANVMFALELDHRARQAGITSVAVHPGTSHTGLQKHVPKVMDSIIHVLIDRVLGQSADQSALPSLYAATLPSAAGGIFIGPTGRFELKGPPGIVQLPKKAHDRQATKQLWDISEKLTGVQYVINSPGNGERRRIE